MEFSSEITGILTTDIVRHNPTWIFYSDWKYFLTDLFLDYLNFTHNPQNQSPMELADDIKNVFYEYAVVTVFLW